MRYLFLCAFVLSLVGAAPAATPSPSPVDLAKSRIETMLKTGHADASWFSESFLAQVPISKVDAVLAQVTSTLGNFESLEFTPETFIAHFEKGSDDILIHLDADMKIDGLLFKPPVLRSASLGGALRALQQPSGTLSYVVIVEGRQRAALNSSLPMAVGSTFKLAILNALKDQIGEGVRRWSDSVPLQAQWKSLPSGELQDWPTGIPITLATYAAQMISISDNTAADALARIVGQKAIQPYAAANRPLPSTRELFILKSTEGNKLRNAYVAARTASDRTNVLKRVDALPLPSAGALLTTPILEIEYHFTVSQLCGLMARVADLPLMSINPGAAEPSSFRRVAYKGGSDVGVVNMTTMVTTKRGTHVCVSATWNDADHSLKNEAFGTAYADVLQEVSKL